MSNRYFKKISKEEKREKLKALPLEDLLRVDLINTGLPDNICRRISEHWKFRCSNDYYHYTSSWDMFKIRDLLKLTEKELRSTKFLREASMKKIMELIDYLGLSLKEEGKRSPLLDLISLQELSEQYEGCKRRGRDIDKYIEEAIEDIRLLKNSKKNCAEDARDLADLTIYYIESLKQNNSQYLEVAQRIYDRTTINEEPESKTRKIKK